MNAPISTHTEWGSHIDNNAPLPRESPDVHLDKAQHQKHPDGNSIDCYLHGHGTVALVNMTPRVYYVILAFIIVTMRVMKFISIAQVLVAVVIVVMQKHGVLKVAVRCIVQKRLMLLKIQIWEMRSQASK